MKAKGNNTRFDYIVGGVTLIGAFMAIMAYVQHSKTRKLQDRLLIVENEIADLELEHKQIELNMAKNKS